MSIDALAEHLREHFEERAGILEYDGKLPRAEAEREAARMTATYARNQGYLWVALRSALSGYPELLAALPTCTLQYGDEVLSVEEVAWPEHGGGAGMTTIQLYGRLGRDPDSRIRSNGKPMVVASVAVDLAREGDPLDK